MICLVLSVFAALAATGNGDAVGNRYGKTPVYSHQTSLQSRRRPFQSTLKPVPPYGVPYKDYLSGPYEDYPLKPYGDLSRLPGGVYRPPPYGLPPVRGLPPVGPNGRLLDPLTGEYSGLPYGDYPNHPFAGYPNPLLNDVYPLSRSENFLRPLLKTTVPPPIYHPKYPSKSGRTYLKPITYPKRNITTTARPYSFSYGLVDVRGNDFGASEESDGREVQGQYSVLLPDGRLQTVTYSVEGDSGFVADVTYEGEAKFVDEDGKEEGRSHVKRGRGPTGGYPDRYHV